MAVLTAQLNVGTTPTPLRVDAVRFASASTGLLIYNRGTTTMYVGGAGVTVTNGFQVDPDQRVSLPVGGPSNPLFGITASGLTVCHVIQTDSYA